MVSRVYLLGRTIAWRIFTVQFRPKARSTISDSEPKFRKNHLLSTPNSDFPVLFWRFSNSDLFSQADFDLETWRISHLKNFLLTKFFVQVCIFTNSGSEANELALMLERLYTKAFDAMSFRNSYHGGSPYTIGLRAHGTWKHGYAKRMRFALSRSEVSMELPLTFHHKHLTRWILAVISLNLFDGIQKQSEKALPLFEKTVLLLPFSFRSPNPRPKVTTYEMRNNSTTLIVISLMLFCYFLWCCFFP